ncbi:STAS domain-containing protein [Fictibacillus aquaticus]|uniref:RsbT co-antagonist protein RsbRB n=1 Tax=Fictibacillus aquaticus TaxID=2021314 RepID=A0A235F6E7_9BACL|nr:STAS domain-containing protein [Fictibacillus aquaticus]OYD56778.1 RsbT co-antagonist protein RsbRB [Fictibacillus aquaticus]
MDKDQRFYQFLSENTWQLTEDWYNSLDKSDPTGVYSSKDPNVIETLKRQNHEFHLNFVSMLKEPEKNLQNSFEKWIIEIAQDKEHLGTPIHYIMREFHNTQNQYLNLVQDFVRQNNGEYSHETVDHWNRIIIETIHKVVTWFTQENYNYSQTQLSAQQELISELSSPVIALTKNVALLPLVGDIDTRRAKIILENTLEQCMEKRITHLLLDLSGVVMFDTMVAQQIFLLIDALNLIGVKTTLSGIRPEVAQTAVQLGIDFSTLSIVSSLQRAISLNELVK